MLSSSFADRFRLHRALGKGDADIEFFAIVLLMSDQKYYAAY